MLKHRRLLAGLAFVVLVTSIYAVPTFLVGQIIGTPFARVGWHTESQAGIAPSCGTWHTTTWEKPDGLLSEYDVSLQKVSAIADDDVWVIGDNLERVHTPNFGGDPEHQHEILLHWNGHMWSEEVMRDLPEVAELSMHPNGVDWRGIDASMPISNGVSLNDVSTSSPNDIWAVGFRWESEIIVPASVHWDGRSWTEPGMAHRTSGSRRDGELNAVETISNGEAWAVGYSGTSTQAALVYHWDGAEWSLVESPPRHLSDTLLDVASLGGNNPVWVIGEASEKYEGASKTYPSHPLLEPYQDGTWSTPIALTSLRGGVLRGIQVLPSGDMWAVGNAVQQVGSGDSVHGKLVGLIVHYAISPCEP